MFQENPEESIRQCQLLLDSIEEEVSLRIGDLCGFIVEYYYSQGIFDQVS